MRAWWYFNGTQRRCNHSIMDGIWTIIMGMLGRNGHTIKYVVLPRMGSTNTKFKSTGYSVHHHIISYHIISDHITSYPILTHTYPILYNPIPSYPILSISVLTGTRLLGTWEPTELTNKNWYRLLDVHYLFRMHSANGYLTSATEKFCDNCFIQGAQWQKPASPRKVLSMWTWFRFWIWTWYGHNVYSVL
jgi:hypothetical protein